MKLQQQSVAMLLSIVIFGQAFSQDLTKKLDRDEAVSECQAVFQSRVVGPEFVRNIQSKYTNMRATLPKEASITRYGIKRQNENGGK